MALVRTWDAKLLNLLNYPCIVLALDVLNQSTPNANQLLFFIGKCLVLTLAISNFQLPASNGIERSSGCNMKRASGAISSYQHGGFPLLPLECGKCNTSSLTITPERLLPPLDTGGNNTFNKLAMRKRWKNKFWLVWKQEVNNWRVESGNLKTVSVVPSSKGKDDW
jgi:hypothetical protein